VPLAKYNWNCICLPHCGWKPPNFAIIILIFSRKICLFPSGFCYKRITESVFVSYGSRRRALESTARCLVSGRTRRAAKEYRVRHKPELPCRSVRDTGLTHAFYNPTTVQKRPSSRPLHWHVYVYPTSEVFSGTTNWIVRMRSGWSVAKLYKWSLKIHWH
jgi:hypothetical protein